MYLLDTNTCICFMKGTCPRLAEKLFSLDPSCLLISSVTVFELEYGAEKSRWGERTRQQLALFLSPFTILPINASDALTAGRIRGILQRQGTPIGPFDALIAAQGVNRGVPVVTHDTGEFSRVPGILLEDWV